MPCGAERAARKGEPDGSPFSFPAPRFLCALLLLVASARAASHDPECSPATPEQAFCVIRLDALHPTQAAIGLLQVEDEVRRLEKKTGRLSAETRIRTFLEISRRKIVPVVIGPGDRFYLSDRHHLARALQLAGAQRIAVKVIGRLNEAPSPAAFWSEMQTRGWAYLQDARGGALPPGALPDTLDRLVDDPYRSLAGFAEDAGYFAKGRNGAAVYFIEFQWARYYGQQMDWQPIARCTLEASLQRAKVLSCAPEAAALPGYTGPCTR